MSYVMRDIVSKIVNFFETHIEKIVLAVVGVVCIWLLFYYVILGPNKVEYQGEKLSPSKIDIEISKEAELLRRKLNEPPKVPEPYTRRLDGFIGPNDPVRGGIRGELQNGFVGLFDSPLSDINTNLYPPMPSSSSLEAGFAREYSLPFISEVNEVAVEHIRAVAFVPASTVDERNAYKKENSKLKDIDFVTVEGKFDVAGLCARFQECFAGKAVKEEEWYDPCLARPIFAAVQLQRQELNSDGTWSDWENVARSRIDPYKKLFEVIEDVQDLPPGGLTIRMLQFNNSEVMINLLQPEAYVIASAGEEWFPPTLHSRYLEQQRQAEIEARRAALEKAKEEREKKLEEKRDERRSAGTDTRGRSGRFGGGEYGTGGSYGGTRSGSGLSTRGSRSERYPSSTTDTRRTPYDRGGSSARTRISGERQSEEELSAMGSKDTSRGPSTNDVYDEFYAITIALRADLAKMREPLLFWAHDDTVEPEKTYHYRIRLGVFNPIAGTNQFSEQDESRKSDVILWSRFSDVTEMVEIPARSYFFANDIREAAKAVTVEVCRYVLGYWYSEKFPVMQGEVIGKVKRVELTPEEQQLGITAPETIDYGTGAVFVDVMAVNDWSGGNKLVAKGYYDMLYSSDGINIEHMPIKTMNWSKELKAIFSDIQKSVRQKKQPLRDWDSRRTELRRRAPERGDYYELGGDSMDNYRQR